MVISFRFEEHGKKFKDSPRNILNEIFMENKSFSIWFDLFERVLGLKSRYEIGNHFQINHSFELEVVKSKRA